MSRLLHFAAIGLGVVAAVAGCGDGERAGSQGARTSPGTAADGPPGGAARSTATADYVGASSCAECHPREVKAFTGSHHDLAMQEATADTVLGDFSAPDFEFAGEVTSFARRDGRFFVTTPGPDGERTEYEVAYTFGVDPLQQYLVAFPGGRYQALGVAWDARPAESGGQRWFHLQPDERPTAGDALHWTSPLANWNQQCADCHSTNLAKNYDHDSRTYETTWDVIDVSCEACHGPASRHVATARAGHKFDPDFGFDRRLTGEGGWILDAGPNARRIGGPDPRVQIDTCAPCHARRSEVAADRAQPGDPLLDGFLPSLLEDRLYHADGQIDDEVYVWGSFLQSRMHAAGVVCTDCHDPHSLDLVLPGNALCTRCHDHKTYDTPDHHHHEVGTAGASCVECHMPSKSYMVVDPRRDHSLRVPRPDLTVTLGTPNACDACHADEGAAWAAQAIVEWTGTTERPPHRAAAFHAARTGEVEGERALAALIADPLQPEIARATALAELAPTAANVSVLERGLADDSAIVVLGALRGADWLGPAQRILMVGPLLDHDRRAVRVEAARVLLAQRDQLDADRRAAFDRAHAERVASLEENADDARTLLGLADVQARDGDLAGAERTLRAAIELGPWYAEPYANLADFLRVQDRDEEGAAVLKQGIARAADPAWLEHALGLNLVRRERLMEALAHLGRAVELRPDVAEFSYVHAVALDSFGRTEAAVNALAAALEHAPTDRDMLNTQISMLMKLDRREDAVRYAERLLELDPNDPDVRAFLERMRGR